MSVKSKTIYILGAGASYTKGLPLQSGILSAVFRTEWSNDFDTDFLDIGTDDIDWCLRNSYKDFCIDRLKLCEFLIDNFFSSTKQLENRKLLNAAKTFDERTKEYNTRMEMVYQAIVAQNITLEDLFTIFDRTASEKSHFHGYSPIRMSEVHKSLRGCIIYTMAYLCKFKLNENSVLHDFAHFLINKRLSQKQKSDCFSIMTINWDILLEKEIFKQCRAHNITSKRKKIYPDLCFYDYSYQNSADHQVSTHVKSKGYWNIKILKMHGSLAWLECPECSRVFTDFSRDIAVHEYEQVSCRYCSERTTENGETPFLRSMIVTPTFIKELGNLHFKNIWHNAFLDLSEATEVVFIGYSFPNADFEMRCLLKQAIQPSTSITVVLSTADDPQPYLDGFISKGYTADKAKSLVDKLTLPSQRFAAFFGGERDIKFIYGGLEGYVEDVSNE